MRRVIAFVRRPDPPALAASRPLRCTSCATRICDASNGRAAAPTHASRRVQREIARPTLAASCRLHRTRKGMRSCVRATGTPRLPARQVARASRARDLHPPNPSAYTSCARGAAQDAAVGDTGSRLRGPRASARSRVATWYRLLRRTRSGRRSQAESWADIVPRDVTFPPPTRSASRAASMACAARLHVSPSPRPQRRRRSHAPAHPRGRRALLASRRFASRCAAARTHARGLTRWCGGSRRRRTNIAGDP